MVAITHRSVSGWTGWVWFAGAAMFVSGIFHIVYGLAAILSYDWYMYMAGTAYLVDATVWGWGMLLSGAILLAAAWLLVEGNMIGRVAGVVLAAIGIIANLAMLPVAPVWSLIVIAINLAVIYAIVAHGDELKQEV